MKQIKVVARNKTTTVLGKPNNDAMVDGLINVSFNEPITIEAGSRIALDKFICALTQDQKNIEELQLYPDLAIEMSSLDLETYDSDKRGRRNVVAYFAPETSSNQENVGTFIYDSKTLSYLSINNEMDIDIGTIVFRVVNVKTGLPLLANYVSFNLLIA